MYNDIFNMKLLWVHLRLKKYLNKFFCVMKVVMGSKLKEKRIIWHLKQRVEKSMKYSIERLFT